MNAEVFSEWLRRQGYHVIRTKSSYWFNTEPHVYQAFPYHWVIQPSEKEIADLIRREKILALRYSTPLDAQEGCISYHAIMNDKNYSLDTLDRRSRQNIRSGLKNSTVEHISFDRFAEEGWLLEKDTEERQGRNSKYCAEGWKKLCMAAANLPGFEVWGAIKDNKVCASLLTFQMDDWCEMITQQCNSENLKDHINNSLTYTVTHIMINRPNIRSIFYTIQSLDAPSSVDEFKFRMGYIAKPLRQRVVLHPQLKTLATPFVYSVLKNLQRFNNNGSYLVTKGVGLLRFYINGKKPLEEQIRPEVLLEKQRNAEIDKVIKD